MVNILKTLKITVEVDHRVKSSVLGGRGRGWNVIEGLPGLAW